MPSAAEIKKRGGLVRVRTKRLPNGTLLRVYVFRKKGKRGGRTWAEKVPPKSRSRSSGKAK